MFVVPQVLRVLDRRRVDSVDAFRDQLAVLERAKPPYSNVTVLRPAVTTPSLAVPTGPAVRPLVETEGVTVLSAAAPVAAPAVVGPGGEPEIAVGEVPVAAVAPVASPGPAVPARQRSSAKLRMRRIHILRRLIVAMGATLLIGLIPPLRVVLVAHLVLDVCFLAYLAALVRLRVVAAERDRKVHYLTPPVRQERRMAPAVPLRHSI